MKLNEIKPTVSPHTDLNEVDLKKAAAGGALVLGTLLSPTTAHYERPVHQQTSQAAAQREDVEVAMLASAILKKYRISPELAKNVAALAKKYEHHSFPKAEDILAIAGVESSFIPTAVSRLKRDPAVGLMQVRPGVWGLDPRDLMGDIEMQIKTGSDILHKYYKLLGNADDAVHAYNVGLGNFKRGNHNPRYVPKYKSELSLYNT